MTDIQNASKAAARWRVHLYSLRPSSQIRSGSRSVEGSEASRVNLICPAFQSKHANLRASSTLTPYEQKPTQKHHMRYHHQVWHRSYRHAVRQRLAQDPEKNSYLTSVNSLILGRWLRTVSAIGYQAWELKSFCGSKPGNALLTRGLI